VLGGLLMVVALVTSVFVGATIGASLGERIGQGGCGAVFLARDPELDREVAIKVVLPTAPSSAEASERLVREAQALAKLGHPNIVRVFDVGVDTLELGPQGSPRRGVYIVMERIDGDTLGDWQADPSRTEREIVGAYVQAARGLAAAHEVGVVHRDFKPANVMRTREGRVVVLDFGLAREDVALTSAATTGDPAGSSTPSGSLDSLTRTGTVMGTPRYMAPEQHAAQLATAAADQYALCVALWEALAGGPAFRGPTLDDIVQAKRRGAPERPVKGRMSRAIHRVIARGLDPEPTRRWPGVSALIEALERASRPRRAASWIALGGGAIGAAAALAMSRAAPMPAWCEGEPPAWVASGFGENPAWSAGTAPRLARFAARWSSARSLACDPSTEVPAEVREAQAACLQRAADAFDTAGVDRERPETAKSAKRRLWGMPSPQRCLEADPAEWFSRTDEEEAELDAIADRMRELLARPTDPAEIAAFVETSIARAEALHDHGIATGLLTLHARITHQGGDYEAAARMDTEAAWRCEAADDPLLAAEHLITGAASLTSAGAPPTEVDRLVAKAIEMAEAAGDPPELAVELGSARAYVASSRGEYDRALELAYEAVRRAETSVSTGVQASMCRALDTAATAHINRGEGYLALPLQRRAVALTSGSDPYSKEKLAFIHRGIAFAAFQTGQPDLAMTSSLESLRLLSEIYAPDHPGLLWDVAFYGFLLTERGQVEEGIAHMQRVRTVLLQAPRSPELGSVLGNLATAWASAGRVKEAERDGTAAIEQFTAQFGPASPQVGAVHLTIAGARLEHGDIEGAKASLASARAAMSAFGDADPGTALVSAQIREAEGDHAGATADALAVIARVGPDRLDGSSLGGRGTAFAILARVAVREGRHDEARVLAAFADPLLRRGGAIHRRHRAELETWIASIASR
jgi:tetratricopeptide (TPR) repeat protein